MPTAFVPESEEGLKGQRLSEEPGAATKGVLMAKAGPCE